MATDLFPTTLQLLRYSVNCVQVKPALSHACFVENERDSNKNNQACQQSKGKIFLRPNPDVLSCYQAFAAPQARSRILPFSSLFGLPHHAPEVSYPAPLLHPPRSTAST